MFCLLLFNIKILTSYGRGSSTSDQGSDAAVTGTSDSNTEFTTTLAGSVGDGPITGATIIIKNNY